MASTLVIGIGSTGLAILEQAEQFVYEFTGKNKPSKEIECVYIETDTKRLPRRTASGKTSIHQIDLSLGDNAVDINQLKNNKNIDSSWVPAPSDILKNMNGAGGMPSYGRLALWGKSNYDKVKNTIQEKYQRINGDNHTLILVVGSLTGGTGAGVCVDIAYLVRDITKNQNINALFLLPDNGSFGRNKSLHENSFSAMSAIDFYTNHEYKITFPDNSTLKDLRPPFNLVQYISQDFTGAKASISSLDELIRVAGVITALHYMDTNRVGNYFADLLDRRRVDSAGASRIKNYISNGFLMIQFPKAQLEELLAIQISEDLLRNLIHPTDYIDQFGNKKSIKGDSNTIKKEIEAKIEDIIANSFTAVDSINTPLGVNVAQAMVHEAAKLAAATYQQPSESRFLYDLFSTKQADNYFELIRNNSTLLRDSIIESFHKAVVDLTSDKKNLTVTKLAIFSFKSYIDELMRFYKDKYNVNGLDTSWDAVLQKHIQVMVKDVTMHKLALQKKEYSEYILRELLSLTEIHCLIPVLTIIKNHLEAPETSLKTLKDVELPNEKYISNLIEIIETVVSGEGREERYTLARRRNQLEKFLDGFSSCFKMVYRFGSRQQDLHEAYHDYVKDDRSRISYDNLFEEAIWPYLKANSANLYSEVIKNSVRAIRDRNIFKDSSLLEIIKGIDKDSAEGNALNRMFDSGLQNMRSQIPAMLKLKDDEFSFGDDACAKLIVVTSDHKKYGGLFSSYKISTASDNACDLPSLDNAIIFYQEYGYMGDNIKDHFNPLKHIRHMQDVKNWISPKVGEKYIAEKVPYLKEEQFKTYLS